MIKRIITLALAIVCLASFAVVGVSALAPEKEGEVVYTATLTTPGLIENIQAYVTYDAAVLEVAECNVDNLGDSGIFNTDIAGTVYFNASTVKGLDFKAEKVLVEIKFNVIGEGDVAAAITVEEMTEVGDVPYFTDSEQVNDAVVINETITEWVAPTTAPTTVTEPTKATDAPATTKAPVEDVTGTTDKPVDTDIPTTGANVAIFAVMAVVAMAGAAVVVLRKKVNG